MPTVETPVSLPNVEPKVEVKPFSVPKVEL